MTAKTDDMRDVARGDVKLPPMTDVTKPLPDDDELDPDVPTDPVPEPPEPTETEEP